MIKKIDLIYGESSVGDHLSLIQCYAIKSNPGSMQCIQIVSKK